MTLQVLIRDADLQVYEEFAADVPLTVEGTVRADYADDVTVSFPASESRYVDLLSARGAGVVIRDEADDLLTSGTVVGDLVRRSTGEDAPGSVTVQVLGDTAVLADRLAWPSPAAAVSAQGDYYRLAAAPAETQLLRLVADQTGPGALAPRRLERLWLPASQGRGRSLPVQARYGHLAHVARRIVRQELGFRVAQPQSGRLDLQVWAGVDRSADIRFSADWGTLPDYEFARQAPEATRAVVLGGGKGAGRMVREFVDSGAESAWGFRSWTVVDRRDVAPTDPDAEALLREAGLDALDEARAVYSLSLQPVFAGDGPRFGPTGDVWLKDLVSFELAHGIGYVEPLRAVEVTLTPADGLSFRPVVGAVDASAVDTWEQREIRRMRARIVDLMTAE